MLSGDEIPPGGEGKLAVTVRSGYRRQQLRQAVNVRSNDPSNGSMTLLVTANVLVELEAQPNLLRFNPKESEQASLVIHNYTDSPIKLSDVHSSSQYVDISVSAMTIPPKGNVTVTGKLVEDTPKGVLSGWLKIRTDLTPVPMLQIRIWGNIL